MRRRDSYILLDNRLTDGGEVAGSQGQLCLTSEPTLAATSPTG
jgi:hypothetical protein